MSTTKPTTPPLLAMGGMKLATAWTAPSGAATLKGEEKNSTFLSPGKTSAKVCGVHGGIKTFRTGFLSQIYIGCWRCCMDQAWNAPPEIHGSTQLALSGALAEIKGRKSREEAISEVLSAIFKERQRDKKACERLEEKVGSLVVENREVGKQWAMAQVRVKELEGYGEKVTDQLDKMTVQVENLDADKEQALKTILLLEGQLKQGEKDREALYYDVREYEGQIKELESRLVALQEQSRVTTASLHDKLAAALLKNSSSSSSSSSSSKEQAQQTFPSSPLNPSPGPKTPSSPSTARPTSRIPRPKEEQQQQQHQTTFAWPMSMSMTTMTAAKAAAGSAAATEVTTVLSSITTSSPISEQDQEQQEQHQEKQQQEQISPSLWPISLMMTTTSNASGGAATAVVNSPSLASTRGGEGEQGVEKKKRRSIGAFFKGLAGKKFDSRNMGTAVAIPAAMTSSLSSNGEAVSSNSSSSSNDAAAEAEISLEIKEKHSPSDHSSPSSPLSSSLCAPRIKISVVAHMNGSERVTFTMYRSDRFQKVMERYLSMKSIDAPLDEVRFVVDNHHHTLDPELTPDDFRLEEGATISVRVPAKPLPEPVMGREGEREEEGEEGKKKGKEAEEMDPCM